MFAPAVLSFLSANSFGDATAETVPADFSPRRFTRLIKPDGTRAVLMEATADQKNEEFVIMSKILRASSVRAPEIFAADIPNGLILMEDFGTQNLGQLAHQGADTAPFYADAAEALAHFHRHLDVAKFKDAKIDHCTTTFYINKAKNLLIHFIPFAKGRPATTEEEESFTELWKSLLTPLEQSPQGITLRDFMLDNIMGLSGKTAVDRIGFIDFQDAGFGPLAYDIASLCESVRRDAGLDLLNRVTDIYLSFNPLAPRAQLLVWEHILAAQRHTRIIGLVASRPEKRVFLPRLWKYIDDLIAIEPQLAPYHAWLKEYKIHG